MKMDTLKMLLALVLALALFLPAAAFAEEALTPGVTVAADPDSATGYTATFVYEDAQAQKVELCGTFAFFGSDNKIGTIPENYISANDWEPGLFRASSSDFPVSEPMTKVEGTNYWTVALPLPSGHYLYNYKVDDAEESITDPSNPPMSSTAKSGAVSRLSTFNVPYDPCQGSSIDFSFMMPREDEQVGEIVFADYTDVNGDMAPLAVYLPYGYDAERAESYKTLYLSHGAGANEIEWFASGNINSVFDNLIADGAVEPTVVVTMNHTNFSWDFPVMNENIINNIIPYMEENFNVGKEPADRAFGGLSMGGMTTTNVYAAYPDQFGYFAILSGCDSSVDLANADLEALMSPKIMLGGGVYDFGIDTRLKVRESHFGLPYLRTMLADLEIPFDYYVVNGGHDWTVWPALIKIFATNYLWT